MPDNQSLCNQHEQRDDQSTLSAEPDCADLWLLLLDCVRRHLDFVSQSRAAVTSGDAGGLGPSWKMTGAIRALTAPYFLLLEFLLYWPLGASTSTILSYSIAACPYIIRIWIYDRISKLL